MLLLEAREGFMNCLECTALDRTLKAALARYTEARSSAFFRVSTELAAMNQVDMERVKSSIQDHKLACPFAGEVGLTTGIEVGNPGAGRRPGKQSLATDGAR
jgi:hypothetical protein